MTNKIKANEQTIKNIVRMGMVWEQEEGDEEAELHYYHITDALNRKWQTIGIHVSDAIQVFENGNYNTWTRIIEPAPYNPDLTANDLINMLNISPDAWRIRNEMQIILNTVERRNTFCNRIVDVNGKSMVLVLHMMKDEYLEHDQLSDELFMKLYIENPVNALSIYFLELLDIITFWEWEAAGGTYAKAIQYKRETPSMTLIQAIERAEDEERGIASGF
ncbi:hypothetical protein [Paenibacillus terrae]|nr:hypothetical protein [Paenibacillus terrae]